MSKEDMKDDTMNQKPGDVEDCNKEKCRSNRETKRSRSRGSSRHHSRSRSASSSRKSRSRSAATIDGRKSRRRRDVIVSSRNVYDSGAAGTGTSEKDPYSVVKLKGGLTADGLLESFPGDRDGRRLEPSKSKEPRQSLVPYSRHKDRQRSGGRASKESPSESSRHRDRQGQERSESTKESSQSLRSQLEGTSGSTASTDDQRENAMARRNPSAGAFADSIGEETNQTSGRKRCILFTMVLLLIGGGIAGYIFGIRGKSTVPEPEVNMKLTGAPTGAPTEMRAIVNTVDPTANDEFEGYKTNLRTGYYNDDDYFYNNDKVLKIILMASAMGFAILCCVECMLQRSNHRGQFNARHEATRSIMAERRRQKRESNCLGLTEEERSYALYALFVTKFHFQTVSSPCMSNISASSLRKLPSKRDEEHQNDDDASAIGRSSRSSLSLSEWLSSTSWRRPTSKDECCICLEGYSVGETICAPINTECNHVFHEACILQWVKSSDKCPLCRVGLLTD